MNFQDTKKLLRSSATRDQAQKPPVVSCCGFRFGVVQLAVFSANFTVCSYSNVIRLPSVRAVFSLGVNVLVVIWKGVTTIQHHCVDRHVTPVCKFFYTI